MKNRTENRRKKEKRKRDLFIHAKTQSHHWGSVRSNAKKGDKKERASEGGENKKGIGVQRGKPLTLTRAINALIGDEEQTGKKMKEQKEINSERTSNPTPLDPSVSS